MNENLGLNKNEEIEKALREFEVKNPEQMQQKQEIPSVLTVEKKYEAPEPSKMVKLVMKISGGAIKEQKQAEYVLLVFAILAIITSLFLFFGGGHSQQKIPPEALEQMKQMQATMNQ